MLHEYTKYSSSTFHNHLALPLNLDFLFLNFKLAAFPLPPFGCFLLDLFFLREALVLGCLCLLGDSCLFSLQSNVTRMRLVPLYYNVGYIMM